MSNVPTSYLLNGSDALVSGLSFKRGYLFNEGTGSTVYERAKITTGLDFALSTNSGGTYAWDTTDASFGTDLSLAPTSPGTAAGPHGVAATSADIQVETYTVAVAMKSSYATNNGGYANLVPNTNSSGVGSIRMLIDYGALGVGLGYVVAQLYDGTTVIRINSGVSVCDGNPHQIIMRRVAQSSLKLYVDGVLKATATDTLTAGSTITTSALGIGDDQFSGGRPYSGKYSYLYIWDSALSDGGATISVPTAGGQIADLYAHPLRMWTLPAYGQYWP